MRGRDAKCVCVCGPALNTELAEAVTFAQASVFCVRVCRFPDGLIASHCHNRGLAALSQPLNTKEYFQNIQLFFRFPSCVYGL